MDNPNTPAWNFFAWASFVCALLLMSTGIWHLPADAWVQGFLVMGTFFLVGSTFTLSKTVRDNQEFANRLARMEREQGKEPLRVVAK